MWRCRKQCELRVLARLRAQPPQLWFSFRLSTLGRQPGATSAQVIRMHLDSAPEAQVHDLQTPPTEQ
ncbi:Hypothetical predicted protein, partial [Marmota monax]